MKKQHLILLFASCSLMLFIQGLSAQNFNIQGFASLNGGTTGGEGGTTVTVSSASDLETYCGKSGSYIIYVSGTITLSSMCDVTSDKSILGVSGTSGVIKGYGLNVDGADNVIIQNLTFTGSADDAIQVTNYSTNVWIDHCDFSDADDGLIDIRLGSNYVTVSWNKFSDHNKCCLIGSDDDDDDYDEGRLKVTYHHNWFCETTQRHPRCRFGKVHVYNNYYDNIGSYGVASTTEAKVYVENNYFLNTDRPTSIQEGSSPEGYLEFVNNTLDNSGDAETNGTTFDPDDYYDYSLESRSTCNSSCISYAGVGIIDPGTGSSSDDDDDDDDSGVTNSYVSGIYSFVAVHSGKALDCYAWGTSNGTNICQWEYWGGNCQKFYVEQVDGYWHRITPYIATDQAIDVYGISTEAGANINTWEYWGGYGQQFRFQVAGSGKWRIINRNSEMCLDVESASEDNGANVLQWTCTANSTWQQFYLTSHSSSKENLSGTEDVTANAISVYPNPASESINVNLPGSLQPTNATIFDQAGRMVLTAEVSTSNSTINISTLEPGMYFIKVNSNSVNFTSKFLIE